MAKYLFEARYTTEGAKGVAAEGGTGRRAAVAKMATNMIKINIVVPLTDFRNLLKQFLRKDQAGHP